MSTSTIRPDDDVREETAQKTVFDMSSDEFEIACRKAVAHREDVVTMDYVTRFDKGSGMITKVYENGHVDMSLTDDSHPRLLVFAAPYGSGKSTITKGIPLCGAYVNVDEIKRVSQCTDLEAAQEAELIRHMLLKARKDFTFETVLSKDRNLELLRLAKEQGYEIHAVFILTSDPHINVRRVKARAKGGGHDTPEEIIINRYEKSLRNLSQLVLIADHTWVVDNSSNEPHLICEVLKQHITIWETEEWSRSAILKLLIRNGECIYPEAYRTVLQERVGGTHLPVLSHQ